ncbi:MAG: coproporphyrinogen III oxidase [Actinobacteria bacterium]|nr:coproporphyrinogen III oxidase [Micrococcales bacterium]MCB0902655.1 coproporphyrinogen III oxidase [Actinomycetota bacterium]MCO5301404.1 radical SAM family heme chaperone HemW [Candidatus Nanopelagicales bacterium]MCB9429976.1 coproporphyrinogen III oxidase [Actinomycetota bacterium]HPE10999.1 radical SAM family heme chaperone HemW [Actinomycetota bacterium]
MPALPDGDPAPPDGRLPAGLDWTRPLRAYLHVPFCASRCGYCDFNTYTADELGGFRFEPYVRAVSGEIELAADVCVGPPLASIFIGGGTPSLLPVSHLNELLDALRASFGLEPGAEVTLEANPENVSPESLVGWLEAGVTRLSIGMQSADPDALTVLQRVHTPGAAVAAARTARTEGFEHISLDLIYGVPGQSLDSWRSTLLSALAGEPDHISAYALGVERGTALERQVRRGEVPAPDPDFAAAQYDLADEVLMQHGLSWYEISNWARPGGQCEHNLGYWRGDNWWGFGPGAHSHVDGVRWWNVKRPGTYQSMLAAGSSPAAAREVVSTEGRELEEVMLQVRLAHGIPADVYPPQRTARLRDTGLLEDADGARLRLTRKGRMLADAVVRVLLGWD